MQIDFSIVVLALVFVGIAVRQVGRVRLPIWQVMSLGAVAVLVAGRISPAQALGAIHIDVILYLFGMFVVARALESSGYLAHIASRFFTRARSADALVLLVIFGMGLASAFLMNDTLAIIGTPVVLHQARRHNLCPRFLLLALAFAITTGSVMSPIGNPQNLLIAVEGEMLNPFITFLQHLFLPTLVSLFLIYAVLKVFYRDQFHDFPLAHVEEPVLDAHLARLARISLWVVLVMTVVKVALVGVASGAGFRLCYIALAGAMPILLFSPRRVTLVRQIDWSTLVFFAAMFVLMESVWESGFFQTLILRYEFDLTANLTLLVLGVLLSQLISNVPLVALILPVLVLMNPAMENFVSLAAGSTLAGNLFILGAASNIIIIQNAENRAAEAPAFMEFAKVGVPLTVLQVAVYWIFLARTGF